VTEGTVGFGVGYGAGNQLPKAIGGAAQLDPQPTAIWYFGDLDIEGLQIAANAEAAAVRHGLPSVRPALPLYQALLSSGVRQSGKKALDDAMAWTATAWLDESLRSVAAAVLSAGTRIAQESVGHEALVSFPVWW